MRKRIATDQQPTCHLCGGICAGTTYRMYDIECHEFLVCSTECCSAFFLAQPKREEPKENLAFLAQEKARAQEVEEGGDGI
jgi:hypothetical protein